MRFLGPSGQEKESAGDGTYRRHFWLRHKIGYPACASFDRNVLFVWDKYRKHGLCVKIILTTERVRLIWGYLQKHILVITKSWLPQFPLGYPKAIIKKETRERQSKKGY